MITPMYRLFGCCTCREGKSHLSEAICWCIHNENGGCMVMYKALPHLHIEKGKCNNPEKWGKKFKLIMLRMLLHSLLCTCQMQNTFKNKDSYHFMPMGIRYKSNKKRHSSNYIKLAYNIVFKKKNKRFWSIPLFNFDLLKVTMSKKKKKGNKDSFVINFKIYFLLYVFKNRHITAFGNVLGK